jgi:hypothetical protein
MKLMFIVVIFATTHANITQAAILTYDFTATISKIWEYKGGQITYVNSSNVPGVTVANGYSITGQFTFDTQTPLSAYQPAPPESGSYILYSSAGRVNNLSLTIQQNILSFESNPDSWQFLVQVANDASTFSGSDILSVSAASAYSPYSFQSATINLFDSTGRIFANAQLPTNLALPSFSYSNIDYAWLNQSDGSQMHANGALTSLTLRPASPVPEPSSWRMLLLGVGLLSGVIKIRSRSQT